MLRAATTDDLPGLRGIERAAGVPFRDLGMAAVADDEPPTVAELAEFVQDGRAWVVTGPEDAPVAYLLVAAVDDGAHVEQVSVHPSHARRGLGRELVDHAEIWARGRGLAALTLTTFADVPWNGPYYERLGFAVVTGHQLGEGLCRVVADEDDRGLTPWPRVVMRREVRRLRLRPLREADEEEAIRAHAELAAEDFVFLRDHDPAESWTTYLQRLDGLRRATVVPPGRVPATFFVAQLGRDLVGCVGIRHELNEHLAVVGGHIGYAVRPAHRRRGYATEMLRQSLVLARAEGVVAVLVTCADDNVGSRAVIERLGGVLEDVRTRADGRRTRRYWIS